jgi:Gas vesicle protein
MSLFSSGKEFKNGLHFTDVRLKNKSFVEYSKNLKKRGVVSVSHQYQEEQQVSLCEALDRILNKGAVVVADVTISVANVDLIYLNLQALIASVETGKLLRRQE